MRRPRTLRIPLPDVLPPQVEPDALAEWQRTLTEVLGRAVKVAENALRADNQERAKQGIAPRRRLTARDARGGRE